MNLHVVHLINNTFDGSVYNHCFHDEAVLALFDTRQCRGTKTLRTALSLPKQAARLLRSSAIFMTLTLQHQCHYSCQRAVITKCSGGIGKPLTRRLVVSENYLVLDEDNGFWLLCCKIFLIIVYCRGRGRLTSVTLNLTIMGSAPAQI